MFQKLSTAIIFCLLCFIPGFIAQGVKSSLENNLQEKVSEVDQARTQINEITNSRTDAGRYQIDGDLNEWKEFYQESTLQFAERFGRSVAANSVAVPISTNVPERNNRFYGDREIEVFIHRSSLLGRLSDIMRALGEAEKDPLIRIEGLRLERSSDQIECNLSVAIPVFPMIAPDIR